jgi:hypothetical protein
MGRSRRPQANAYASTLTNLNKFFMNYKSSSMERQRGWMIFAMVTPNKNMGNGACYREDLQAPGKRGFSASRQDLIEKWENRWQQATLSLI